MVFFAVLTQKLVRQAAGTINTETNRKTKMFDSLSFIALSLQVLALNWADQAKPYGPLLQLLTFLVGTVVGGFTVANVVHHW